MTALYVKDFPEELARSLKAMAALQGKTLKVLVIEILRAEVKKSEMTKRR